MSFVAHLGESTAVLISGVVAKDRASELDLPTTGSEADYTPEISSLKGLNLQVEDALEAPQQIGHSGEPQQVDLGPIFIIEPRTFLRECIRRGMQATLPCAFRTLPSVDELQRDPQALLARLIVLSCSASDELKRSNERANLERLRALLPQTPIVVLASRQDVDLVHVAFDAGAKGYIPMSMGFDLAVQAVRFVLAGGTYVPAEFLTGADNSSAAPQRAAHAAMTARELSVVRAIQQGKPNKVIAYELNMCESTVKVHVRHIMKKLGAKNRTAVAIKSNELLGASNEAR
jgi:DNA-binding NarL/FixJ family response regulator